MEEFNRKDNQPAEGQFPSEGPASPEREAEPGPILETLEKILVYDDDRCRTCALHGLGHLHHPHVFEIVQAYLEKNKELLSDEGFKWVENCRDGIVM